MEATWEDIRSILPALIMAAGAFVVVGTDMIWKRGAPRMLLHLLVGATFVGTVAHLLPILHRGGEAVSGFEGAVAWDHLSIFLTITILAGSALSVFLVENMIERFHIHRSEVLALLLLATSGMLFLVMATELVTLFIALELMSMAVYVLTGAARQQPRSNEASMKYFIIGSFASAILLYGFALLYGATGSVFLSDIQASLTEGVTPLALTGLGLSLIGFGFKVGAVPFHVWLPDAYEGAPTPVTGFMSVTVKAAAFGILLRFLIQGVSPTADVWRAVILSVSIATMLLGNLCALGQSSVKRMLAYSSIAHSGYLLIGIAAASTGAAATAVAGVGFYLLVYTFMTLGAFAMLIYVSREGREAETFQDFEGLSKNRPWAAAFMTIFMISLAGLPPTGGFLGKFYIFKSALEASSNDPFLIWAVVAGIVTSVVSLAYYLRVVVCMYLKPLPEGITLQKGDEGAGNAIFVSAVITLLLGIAPGMYLNLAEGLARAWLG